MKNSAGATWDAATAGNAIGTWTASFGDQIDVVVSNNDGMGMSMFNAWAKDNKVPTFGYDANSDAVAAIAEGYGGTISSACRRSGLSDTDKFCVTHLTEQMWIQVLVQQMMPVTA